MSSYTQGPDAPLVETTIAEALQRTVNRAGDRDALIVRHQNQRLTWVQLSSEVERIAQGLAGLGLRAGDRVGIWATNWTPARSVASWPILRRYQNLRCRRGRRSNRRNAAPLSPSRPPRWDAPGPWHATLP